MTGVDILVLFLILEEKLSTLHCWVWCGVSFGLATYGLYYVWVCQKIKQINPKGNQLWIFIARTDAKAENPILWPPEAKNWLAGKDPDAGKVWRQKEKGVRGWDGWMASPTRWMWVWVNSGIWWWTGRPGVLRFMRSQRVRHEWATELNWTELNWTESFWKMECNIEYYSNG